ncbi:MAG: polyprenyl diphosphate synthase [Leptospirillia bacterium]
MSLSADRWIEEPPSWLLKPPVHLAIIMDGNGRWAKKRLLPRVAGHRQGAQAVRRTVSACRAWGIRYLTLYAFSWENWKRSRPEVDALMALLEDYLDAEEALMKEKSIRFRTIGNRSRLPLSVAKRIEAVENSTREGKAMDLILALSYSGREEILAAIRRFAVDVQKGVVQPDILSEEAFDGYLDTAGVPPPDLLVRTSGEHRISNFLLWQIAYTELFFDSVLWPDFGEENLKRALMDYQERQRRFGAEGESPSGVDGPEAGTV